MGVATGQEGDLDRIQAALEGDLERILALQAAGKALSARDRKVLEGVLEGELARQAGGEREPLALESDLTGVLSLGTIEEMAAAYGYSQRAIKNWRARGRKAGSPCPIERPAEMPAWFETVFAPRECPARLREAVDRLLSAAPAEVKEDLAEAPVPVEIPTLEDEDVGFEATLQRALRREALLDKRLQRAIEESDPRVDALETQWGKAASRVRELEKAAPAILEAQGVYLRRSEVKSEVVRLTDVMRRGLRAELRRRRRDLQGAGVDEYDGLVDEVLAQAFGGLCASRFADPLELEAAG